jgi:hypothetical protein
MDSGFALKLAAPLRGDGRVSVKRTGECTADRRHGVCVVAEVRRPNYRLFIGFGREETSGCSFQCMDGISRTHDVVFSTGIDPLQPVPN